MNCDQVFDALTRGPFPSGHSQDAAVESHLSACHECRQLAEALRPAVAMFKEAIGPEESRKLPGYRGRLQATWDESKAQPMPARDIGTAIRRRANETATVSVSTHNMSAQNAARENQSSHAAWRIAAAIVLGIGLGAMLRAMADAPLNGKATARSDEGNKVADNLHIGGIPPVSGLWNNSPNAEGRKLLASLKLPANCISGSHLDGIVTENASAPPSVQSSAQRPVSAMIPASVSVNCCTECHRASKPTNTQPAISKPATLSNSSIAMVTRSCSACHQGMGL